MPKRPQPPTPPPEEPQKNVAELLEMWRANPFHYFSREEIQAMFNIGEDSMKKIAEKGAPVVARKFNPDHLKAWLYERREDVKKLLT